MRARLALAAALAAATGAALLLVPAPVPGPAAAAVVVPVPARGERSGKLAPGAFRAAVERKAAMAPLRKSVRGADGAWSEYGKGPLLAGASRYAGRVDNFAYDPEGKRLFAAVGTGGIWMSEAVGGDIRTLADAWVPVGDSLPSLVNGGVVWTPAEGGTLIAAGGESVMGNNGYMGLGAFWTTDLGQTWNQSAGFPDGAQVYNAKVDPGNPSIVYIASTKGLFRSTDAGRSFVNARLPTRNGDVDCAGVEDVSSACQFTNFVTDVVIRFPGGATAEECSPQGCAVIAATGWRAGQRPFSDGRPEAGDNGLFRSDTGEPGSFVKIDAAAANALSPVGLPAQERMGRIELGVAYGDAQDHNYVYAIIQDAVLLNEGYGLLEPPLDAIPLPNSPLATIINGIYVSADFGGSWLRMADTEEIAFTPGSLGLLPGVQTWYNLWITPDPTRQIPQLGIPTRLTFGMEEVWQNRTAALPIPLNGVAQQGPADFEVIGRYTDVGQFTTTHPDQHAGFYIPTGDGGVCLFAGNDGGVYKQCAGALEEMNNQKWGTGASEGMYTLLPYGLAVAEDGTVWWGLQDNGSGHIEPGSREQFMDFGADGFFAEVDPNNSNVAYTESQNGGLRRTVDRGATSTGIAPPYTRVNFANWFSMDPQDAQHMVTGAQQLYETHQAQTVTGATWEEVFNLGINPDTSAVRTATVMDVEGDAIYAGFCGDCGHTADQTVFQNGIATNVGGQWHFAAARGLDNRFIAGMEIDPADPNTVYVTLAGYMANIRPAGSHLDANPNIGSGNVFKSTDAGETFSDISGNLPRVQVNSVLLRDGQLLIGTDIGPFISSDVDGGEWAPLGNDLPSVPTTMLRLRPGHPNELFASTFGRGIWVYEFPADAQMKPATAAAPRFGGALTPLLLGVLLLGWRLRARPA